MKYLLTLCFFAISITLCFSQGIQKVKFEPYYGITERLIEMHADKIITNKDLKILRNTLGVDEVIVYYPPDNIRYKYRVQIRIGEMFDPEAVKERVRIRLGINHNKRRKDEKAKT